MTRRVAIVLSLLSVLLTSCGRNPSTGTTGSSPSDAGASQRRLVVLSPAIAVMLQGLGFEDEIVGKHTWDMVLGDEVPVLGDQFELDYEQLMTLHPTHVYTQYESAGPPGRLTELADQHGWHLEDYKLNSLTDIATTLDDLYLDLGGEFMTDRELTVESFPIGASVPVFADSLPSDKLAAAWADRGPSVRGAGRVLLLAQGDSPAVLGPGSFHHQILTSLGGTPAIPPGEGSPWMDLDAEDVLRLAPDAIVLFAPRTPSDDDRWPAEDTPWEDLVERLGAIATLPIPAIENRRVLLIDHPLGLLPSPALAEVAEQMAGALEEWSE